MPETLYLKVRAGNEAGDGIIKDGHSVNLVGSAFENDDETNHTRFSLELSRMRRLQQELETLQEERDQRERQQRAAEIMKVSD